MVKRAAALVLCWSAAAHAAGEAHEARLSPNMLGPGAAGWQRSALGGMRGITIGPIESSLHPGKGYGSEVCARSMSDARRLGASWVSLTPFGRVLDLTPTGIDPTFEAPFEENRRAIERAIAQAHAEGLRVLLVPHLWVETGEWRALIDPRDEAGWARWATAYGAFIQLWAEVAERAGADMFSVGVELRNWVTTTHAPSFIDVISEVRRHYSGLITYAANWDDVEQTVILGSLDVIGINAFYPLAEAEGAPAAALAEGGRKVAERVEELALTWNKPVLFTEIGYTTRPNPAVRPWSGPMP
jgi:hypothetical protein